MNRVPASSPRAQVALALVETLQRRFVERLADSALRPVEWQRDQGRHGGGVRFACAETARFNGASVNVSCVHYDDEPGRKLASATALSAIVHPRHPWAPSLHLHLSFTELREGKGSWRLMADLNPSHPVAEDTARFEAALKGVAPEHFAAARAQGDRYFSIPALGRHRGVSHWYLEDWSSGDFEADRALAQRVGETVIDLYCALVSEAEARHGTVDDAARARQLAYHTVYLFQVLTLDRGTTSGLMIHDQNDLGIMGSLPAWVDRALLASWEAKVPAPQDELVRALVAALPAGAPAHVTEEVRLALAGVVRAHYRAHPEALELQARGNVLPPTVANHGPR